MQSARTLYRDFSKRVEQSLPQYSLDRGKTARATIVVRDMKTEAALAYLTFKAEDNLISIDIVEMTPTKDAEEIIRATADAAKALKFEAEIQ